ncbi:hypothetical protein BGZ54_007909, partial [Gamsiella multidivaricata]
ENGWTQRFFEVWFANLDKFSRVHDKKLSIFALCAIINVPVEQLPATLQSAWPQVLNGIIRNFEGLPTALAKRKEMEKMYNIISDDEDEDDEDDDDEDEEGQTALEKALASDEEGIEEDWVDDEEDVYDEGHEYLEYLAQQAAKKSAAKEDGEEEDDDAEEDEDEDDADDLEEEIYFESPLDDLDPYVVFGEVFTGLQQHNPASYNELTKALTAEQQAYVMHLLQVAKANAEAATEAAAGEA